MINSIDVRLLVSREEIEQFFFALWATDEARNSHQNRGWLHDLVQRAARLPIGVFEIDEKNELAPFLRVQNFGWMRLMPLRSGNGLPGVRDLYYINKLAYLGALSTQAAPSWVRWYSKMSKAAFEASFASEVGVYTGLAPSFREQTFPFEIWADRFLQPDCEIPGNLSLLEWMRQRRMLAIQTPDPFDFLELQLHSFERETLAWAEIWQHNYRKVEDRMDQFGREAQTDRQTALEGLVKWLTDGVVPVVGMMPFQREAEQFFSHAQRNRLVYGNEKLAL